MVYIQRNAQGHIQSVSNMKDSEHQEEAEQGSPELAQFLLLHNDEEIARKQQQFIESDMQMVRVLEDLINVLIEKHIINFTDLPTAAQEKILVRQTLRDRLTCLISEDEDKINL